MIYLIGGASYAGKTHLALEIAKRTSAGWFSIDALRQANAKLPCEDQAPALWPLVRGMIHEYLFYDVPYVFEGGSLSVEQLAEATRLNARRVRCCVLGFVDISVAAKVEEIRTYAGSPNDWLKGADDEKVAVWVTEMIANSRKLRADCADQGVPFIDTGRSFREAMEEACNTFGV